MVSISNSRDKANRQKVLFLCSRNSARSQMAEGLLRAMYGDRYEAYSAGVEATSVDPHAVEVMNELGIDISGHRSKRAEEFRSILFDIAVTVCDNAKAKTMCPICGTTIQPISDSPMAKTIIHKSFIDPATSEGSEEEKLAIFRQVRDEIKEWITHIFGDSIN
ncbi:MAG: arsenate reductase ArsC [Methanotrichaceae archaeon]|nr:arsenate reductase ArsC [Methanotrichaceae archaeon]